MTTTKPGEHKGSTETTLAADTPSEVAVLYHERLDVYQLSLELVARSIAISEQLPRGYGSLGDQLRRAAISVPLNIAEGVGKRGKTEKARFHAIARGSAMECGAILDVVKLLQKRTTEPAEQAKVLAIRVVEMLTKMCR